LKSAGKICSVRGNHCNSETGNLEQDERTPDEEIAKAIREKDTNEGNALIKIKIHEK